MSVVHPILPTAVAIKQAMDDIYEAAKEVFDLSPWLDARGRLPFKNILPMLEAAPTSGSADKDAIVWSMIKFTAPFFNELDSDTIYKLADNLQLRMKSPGVLHLPTCTYIGSHAFERDSRGNNSTGITLGKNTESFASLEEIGANAFGSYCLWPDSHIISFPKLKTIGESGIFLYRREYNLSMAVKPGTGEMYYPPYVTKTWEDHLYLSAVENIAIGGILFDPLAPRPDEKPTSWNYRYCSRHYVHFPGKTMAQVKAMANYPKFTVGAYRYVCDDGEFQPPDQED